MSFLISHLNFTYLLSAVSFLVEDSDVGRNAAELRLVFYVVVNVKMKSCSLMSFQKVYLLLLCPPTLRLMWGIGCSVFFVISLNS